MLVAQATIDSDSAFALHISHVDLVAECNVGGSEDQWIAMSGVKMCRAVPSNFGALPTRFQISETVYHQSRKMWPRPGQAMLGSINSGNWGRG